MKFYTYKVPNDHFSHHILRSFGDVKSVNAWPPSTKEVDVGPSIIFARLTHADELPQLCSICEERGDWCFVWANKDVLEEIAKGSFPILIDFVNDHFNDQELTIRLNRLVSLQRYANAGTIMGVPTEIAEELTKKQLVILKALFEAGEQGLGKKEISDRIWKHPGQLESRASGFNVHILHLRRKLEGFGLMIDYNSQDKIYQLKAALKPKLRKIRAPRRAATLSQ